MMPRPGYIAALIVALMVLAVSGCAVFEPDCGRGMVWRDGACQGFGDGFVWRRSVPRGAS